MATSTQSPVGGAAAAAPPAGPARLTLRQRLSRWDLKVSPYLYIAPFFLIFAVVGLYPLIYTGYLSFFEWQKLHSAHGAYLGFQNYTFVLHDPMFWKAFWNTIGIFLLSSVPQVIIATVVAALLDTNLRGRSWWRMSVILPFIVAPAAVALIFGSVFADKTGLVNEALRGLHLGGGIHWQSNRFASWTAIATMVDYRWTGYNALIILAAMQAVPRDIYESAEIDGASRVKQFFYVTLPSIRPTMIFVIVTSTIGGLQIFTEPRMFDQTPGSPGGASSQFTTLTMYVYRQMHDYGRYGRASAGAWVLFLIIVLIALLNFLITRTVQRRSAR
jgi:cellobiose transport system permease protein